MGVRGGTANSPSRSQTRFRGRATTGGTANRGTQSSLQMGGGHTRSDSNRRESGRHNLDEMTESQVVGFLGRKIWQSMNDEDGDLSDLRKENFNYYIGTEYGNERAGYSSFVTREVLETIEWVLPSVLRVFLGGDKIAVFDPVGPDDEPAAKQETEITNYFVMKKNRGGEGGFKTLHHWMKDCLMYPNGYLKAYMEEKTHVDIGVMTGLSPYGVQMVVDNPDQEILEQRSRMVRMERTQYWQPPMQNPQDMQGPMPPDQMGMPPQMPPGVMPGATDNMMGDPAPMSPGGQPNPNDPPPAGPAVPDNVFPMGGDYEEVEVFDLKVRTEKQIMELRLDPVPPEECLVDNDCMDLNLDTADFVCHRVRKPYTQLVEEGFDPDELDQVGLGEDYQWNDERVNRLFYEDEDPDAEDEDDPSMRTFWVHECYAWFDFDGTGLAQHRRVVLIGDRVFENVEINYQPMIAMSAVMMQHKHTGMSYVEIVKELQVLSSVLTRQLLDNTYKINVRRKVFSEDALTEDGSTMEAILNTQAEFIPVRGPAQAAFVPEPTQSVIGELLPVIEYAKNQVAMRSGVTPESGVSANDLQEVRQDVFTNALDRASQRIEMLVRIFAETGYRQLMLKVHQLLRSHWDMATAIKLRGEWVEVDPSGWRDRTDMTINVGLGFNTKQQQMGMLVQLLSMQKEAAGQGLSDPKKIFNTLEKLIHSAGMGNAGFYFVDPESEEYQPPEPPPDPQMILAQAQAQALTQEQARKDQEFQVNAQNDQMKAQLDFQKGQQDAMTKQAELADKAADRALKEREVSIKEAEMVAAGQMSEAEIDNKRADTRKKDADADKAMAEAAAIVIENSETYQKAVQIVAGSAELNPGGGNLSARLEPPEEDDDGDAGQTDTEET